MNRPRVVVVGAGPAGISAAVAAHRHGCAVTLLDEAPRPGGQIYRQPATGIDFPVGHASERARGRALLSALEARDGAIDYRAQATAYALFPGPELHVAWQGRTGIERPDAVVLATGVSERAVPFPGWTLPGVMYAGGMQAMLKAAGVRPGARVALAGAGPLLLVVAAQLLSAGVDVAGVALLHPLQRMLRYPWALWSALPVVREGVAYYRRLRRARVPLLSGCVPVEAAGNGRVESLLVARHDGSGRAVEGTAHRFDGIDAVGISFGFTANSELALMAGARVRYSPETGGWVPVTTDFGSTAVAGVYVAGDCAGLRGALVAAVDGRIAGTAAAGLARGENTGAVQAGLADAHGERRRHLDFQQAVRSTLVLPDGVWSWARDDTIVCRCESVTRGALRQAVAEGHASLDAIKRHTRAGMGWCGGRSCAQACAAFSAGGRPPPHTAPIGPRPPARPVPLGAIAGRGQT